jgi:hypothetical protein
MIEENVEQFISDLTDGLRALLEVAGESSQQIDHFQEALYDMSPMGIAMLISLCHKYWCHISGVTAYMVEAEAMEFSSMDALSREFIQTTIHDLTQAMYTHSETASGDVQFQHRDATKFNMPKRQRRQHD